MDSSVHDVNSTDNQTPQIENKSESETMPSPNADKSDLHFEKSFLDIIHSPSFSEYLAPAWIDERNDVTTSSSPEIATDETGYVIYDDKSQSYISITELVSFELESYVNIYINAFVDSFKECIEAESGEAAKVNLQLITSKLQALVGESIRNDAAKNSQYCKKLVHWLASKSDVRSGSIQGESDDQSLHSVEQPSAGQELSNQISSINEMCDEYMKFAPGPWRECVLIDSFKGRFLPELQSTVLKQLTQAVSTPRRQSRSSSAEKRPAPSLLQSPDEKNKSESTEIEEVSLSVSEGDDFSESVSSVGGDRSGLDQSFDQTISVSLNNSLVDNSVGQKTPSRDRNRRLRSMMAGGGAGAVGARGAGGGHRHMALNKYKTEIAMLQNQLEDAQAVDKTILQNRIREYQMDVDSLRDRNTDLREQVSELNMKVFEMMLADKKTVANKSVINTSKSQDLSRQGLPADHDDSEHHTSPSDEDDEFQDAVANVEDAYAVSSLSSKKSTKTTSWPPSESQRFPTSKLPDQGEEYSSDIHLQDMVQDSGSLRDDCARLRETVVLFEKQFEIMKTEIRYLRMTESRGVTASRRVAHSEGPGGSPFASLNEKALRVVADSNKAPANAPIPIADTVVNHTVSFSPTTNIEATATSRRNSRASSFDYMSEDGIWKTVNELNEEEDRRSLSPIPMSMGPGQGKPPLASTPNTVQHSSEQKEHQEQSVALEAIPSLSLRQKKYLEKMIQRGIDASKDIDKKTIQSLSEEVNKMNELLQQKESQLLLAAANSASLDDEASAEPPSSDHVKKSKTESELELELSRLKLRGTQQPYAAYQVHLLYSFIFGGIIVMMCSAFISWIWSVI